MKCKECQFHCKSVGYGRRWCVRFACRRRRANPDRLLSSRFKARLPDITVTHSVDVSKNHAPRYDIEAPGGYTSVLHHNTSPGDFHRWMLKRATVERFRDQMRELIGPSVRPEAVDLDYTVKPE